MGVPIPHRPIGTETMTRKKKNMTQLDYYPGVTLGDTVTVLRGSEMREGCVVGVECDQRLCQVAIGDVTREGHLTVSETLDVPCSRLSPLGVGRWVLLEL